MHCTTYQQDEYCNVDRPFAVELGRLSYEQCTGEEVGLGNCKIVMAKDS